MGKIREKIDREIGNIESGLVDQDVQDVMIGLGLSENKIHWHLPADDDRGRLMVKEAMGLYNINEEHRTDGKFKGNERVKMTLHMPLGDRLVFSAGLRDFKKAFPETKVGLDIQGGDELWLHNPYVEWINGKINNHDDVEKIHLSAQADEFSLQKQKTNIKYDIEIKPGCQEATNKSNSRDWHYVHAFRESMEGQLGVRIPMGPIKPDVWISEEEYHARPLVDGPYWLITAGINPSWTYKTYPFERWQELVSMAKDITFVQIGIGGKIGYNIKDKDSGKDVKHTYEVPILQGDNVVNMVGKTDGKNLRNLLNLFLHCEGSIGLVSSQMHFAAAFDKPCVVLAGAREPVWFTRYFGHQYVTSEGCLPCSINRACWKCNENCQFLVGDVPKCVDIIRPQHILDRLNYYYDGGRLTRGKKSPVFFENVNKYLEKNEKNVYINSGLGIRGSGFVNPIPETRITKPENIGLRQRMDFNLKNIKLQEINFLASFSTAGGGEQSARKMVQVFRDAGWTVNAYSWAEVHQDYRDIGLLGDRHKIAEKIHVETIQELSLPLIVIGNDQVYEMPKDEVFHKIVENSSQVFMVINWAVGDLPKQKWLLPKLRAVIFHNSEKIDDWKRKEINGFENIQLIPFMGAIDIEKFLEYPVPKREKNDPLVIIKHGVADNRKYVTKESQGKGEKIHLWQKHCFKELDTVFYERLLNSKLKKYNLEFRFMQAPSELVNHFKNHPQFKFYKWNEIPVNQFLSEGHLYLDRCSDEWRHNFPRTAGENLAAGIPIIAEDRDGWADRIDNGDTGFLCCHYNDYEDKIDLLARKEAYRYEMGLAAREYAKVNLDPRRWVSLLGSLIGDN